jgi:hypothetical protein
MKYKIQTRSPFGWADLKTASSWESDQDEYVADLFNSKKEAEVELIAIIAELGDSASDYRIVDESVIEDGNLY